MIQSRWRAWRVRFKRNEWAICTPWFYVWLSYGAVRLTDLYRIWGIEVAWEWDPQWKPGTGRLLFLKKWTHDFRPAENLL